MAMKGALAAIILLAAACSFEAAPLPTATAQLHWGSVPLKTGSYCWSSGGRGTCVDAAPVDDLLRMGYLKPYRTAGCFSALIEFSREPSAFDVALVYSSTVSPGPVSHQGHQFDITPPPGTYVYGVSGTWPEGDVSFFLALEVIPGCA